MNGKSLTNSRQYTKLSKKQYEEEHDQTSRKRP